MTAIQHRSPRTAQKLPARAVIGLLALLGVIAGVLSPVAAMAQEGEPAPAAAPTVEAVTIVEGETVKVGWAPGSIATETVALISAPDATKDDPSTWKRVDRLTVWSEDGIVVNLADIAFGIESVYAYSGVDVNGGLTGLSDWSDPFVVGTADSFRAASFTEHPGTRAVGTDRWCDGTPGAYPCASWPWGNGLTTSQNIGLMDGCDVIPRTYGTLDMCGAYSRGVPHRDSTTGAAAANKHDRNPYGWGYCIDDGASASSASNPVQVPVPARYYTNLPSSSQGYPTSRPRAMLANYILTHYGNPSLWDVNTTLRPGTTQIGVSTGGTTDGVDRFTHNTLHLNQRTWSMAERIAAVNVAVKLVLQGGYGSVVDGDPALGPQAGPGDQKVRDLAEWLRKEALAFATVPANGLTLEVRSKTDSQIRLRVRNNFGYGVPMPGIAVKPVSGSASGIGWMTTPNGPAVGGEGATQHPADSYNFTNQLSAGGGYTDANGEIVFDIATGTDPWAIRFHAEAPLSRITMWAGVSGSQTNVMSGGTIADTVTVQGTPAVTGAEAYIRKTTTNPGYQTGEGAVFTVYEGSDASGPVAATLTVQASGTTNVAALDAGTYHIVETSVPNGQVISFAPQTVTLVGGDRISIDAENGVETEGEIGVIKVDAVTGDQLGGGEFSVAYDSDNNGSFETDITTLVSVDNAPVTVGGLQAGNYLVTEVRPPDGYTLPPLSQRSQVVRLTYGEPGAADDVLTVTITMEDNQPVLTSQVVNQAGSPVNAVSQVYDPVTDTFTIPEVADLVTIAHIPDDVEGTVTTRLYGPQTSTDPDGFVCSTDTLVSESMVSAQGPGPHVSVNFSIPEPGIYTFVSDWAGDDGSAATQPCGELTETLSVPNIATQISDQDTSFGDPIFDTAELTGVLDGVTGTIDVTLYGPFASIGDIECTPEMEAWSSTVDTVGSGTFVSDEFTPTSAGVYTFVETWTSDDSTSTATHRCGEETETTVMQPSITTEVAEQVTTFGDPIADVATLTGVPDGFAGEVTFDLYGPYASSADIDCASDDLVWSGSSATDGSAPVTSDGFVTELAGVYSYVASWVSASGELSATHECGLASETTVANPSVVTEVNNQEVIVGGSVFDISTLVGVPDGFAGVSTFELHGPFASVDDIECGPDTVYATVSTETVGSGVTNSPEITVNEPGVYTFVQFWESESGEISTSHPCGIPAETFVASGGGGGGDGFSGGGGGGDELARTGSELSKPLVAGLVLVVIGAGFVLVFRRRVDEAEHLFDDELPAGPVPDGFGSDVEND